MHGLAYVLIPPSGDVDLLVEASMKPHQEDDGLRSGWWDWFQIGGRFSGRLDGYDPFSDPRNVAPCRLCGGTGRRPDADLFGSEWLEWSGGCNGCKGTGKELVWPTRWARHPGDVAELSAVSVNFADSLALVAGECGVARERWVDGKWAEMEDSEYEAAVAALIGSAPRAARVVVVDFHN